MWKWLNFTFLAKESTEEWDSFLTPVDTPFASSRLGVSPGVEGTPHGPAGAGPEQQHPLMCPARRCPAPRCFALDLCLRLIKNVWDSSCRRSWRLLWIDFYWCLSAAGKHSGFLSPETRSRPPGPSSLSSTRISSNSVSTSEVLHWNTLWMMSSVTCTFRSRRQTHVYQRGRAGPRRS